ncbi:hypothetical protein T12_15962 [Trichinella patagoniensis]|uniref:Uncharacterized protein n=1 Tax=Trichinella patagoniensis TaxID=990121 RepID=A0A0V0YUH7_9BILA|nr:hypothetical protein T12_15962 [Trichinella patagoniensis]
MNASITRRKERTSLLGAAARYTGTLSYHKGFPFLENLA